MPRSLLPENPAPTCPVSRSGKVLPLCQVDGHEVWRCPESGTDFVWPMPDEQTLKTLYDREAWFEGGERGGYQDYDTQTEPSLQYAAALLDRFPVGEAGRFSVLDIGCGYGNHLRLAADRGWKCFGIEPSAHAREVAIQRLGERAVIVERAEDLLPQRFDLIFMFEVIEHLQDPYPLFFTLFGRDAIDADTRLVITTPNARSYTAVADPAGWDYRHPPSHLVFYSARSLEILLKRLMFKNLRVTGIVPLPASSHPEHFADETPSVNDELGQFIGIAAEVDGSDFKAFMHERYVPGAFWKLTEYEHLPRYSLAKTLAAGARVLDFGCGTGYGAATLAEVAESVIGLDISADAIQWAAGMHRNPRLSFQRRADLGRGLLPASFDLVTCFEMIEHVDHETQQETIRSIARLLTPEGKLVISTPDPQFTADYGPNPYHLREMDEAEFMALLKPAFKHVRMLKQWVRPSILIGAASMPGPEPVVFGPLAEPNRAESLVGFVAVCSNQPFEALPPFCQFDTTVDFNHQTLETEHRLNRLRQENYSLVAIKNGLGQENQALLAGKAWLENQVAALAAQLEERDRAFAESKSWLESQVVALGAQLEARDRAFADSETWLKSQVSALEAQLEERSHAFAESKTWLENQVSTLETQLEERSRAFAESKAWLENQATVLEAQLEERDRAFAENKAWLESQVTALETQLEERDRAFAESKAWLESQTQTLATQLQERDRVLAETRAWVATLTEGKAWLEAQTGSLESALIESQNALVEARDINADLNTQLEAARVENIHYQAAIQELQSSRVFQMLLRTKALVLKHFPGQDGHG